MVKTREEVEALINEHRREFVSAPWFSHTDMGLDDDLKFEDAEFRILLVFGSTGNTRAVSNTFVQLHSLIKRYFGSKVFVDYAYLPPREDFDLYRELGLPFVFGNKSKAPLKDYDFVQFSLSIYMEFLNLFYLWKFSDVPMFHYDRLSNPSIPLIMAGGISIDEAEVLHGHECGSLVDFVYSGQAEDRMVQVIQELINLSQEGYEKGRIEPLREHKLAVIEHLVKKFDNIYYPNGYELSYELNGSVREIKKKYDWVPDKVKYYRCFDFDNAPHFEDKVFAPDGSNSSNSDLWISMGCGGTGSCYFCLEGLIAGPWREISMEAFRKSLERIKLMSAPNAIRFFSYNINYHSHFLDLVYETIKEFSNMTTINMRIDALADCPEYFETLASVNLVKAQSMAIEGVSQRVRDHILNKNVTFEQIRKAINKCFQKRYIDIKFGMIWTGQETAEDLQSLKEEMSTILNDRAQSGANTSIRMTFTPLVHYSDTPMMYLQRNTARTSGTGEKTMNALFDILRELGIRGKVNGSGGETFVQQFCLDYARLATKVIWEMMETNNWEYKYGYSSRINVAVRDFINEWVIKNKVDLEVLFSAKPREYKWPTFMIERVPEKEIATWFDKIGKVSTSICLKTPSNLKPKCHKCELCPTPQHKKFVLTREIKNNATPDTIKFLEFENKPTGGLRVVVNVGKADIEMSKTALSHFVVSRMLQSNPELVPVFHSVTNYSTQSVTKDNQQDYFGGFMAFDMLTRAPITFSNWKQVVMENTNKKLHGCKIVSISEVGVTNGVSNGSVAVYAFETKKFSLTKLKEFIANYKGTVKKAAKGGCAKTLVCAQVELDVNDFEVYAQMVGDKVIGTIKLPYDINPYLLLATLTGKPMKSILTGIDMSVIGVYTAIVSGCRCGENSTRINYYTQQPASACPDCVAKSVLVKLSR